MTVRPCDIAILGGGLAGGLLALALARWQPQLGVLLVEQDARLGGNHIWSFFGTDVDTRGRALLAPLVDAAWRGYDVRFPRYQRTLPTCYYAMTGERLDAAVRQALPDGAILTGARVLSATAQGATLADGTRIEARSVIDARGIRQCTGLTGGWQKFVGRRFRLARPHGLERPIVMDATVDQIDGYRFVYVLPFGPDDVFVEDTYYADGPALDRDALAARIDAYVAAQGWHVTACIGEEQGVLPVVAGGDFRAFLRAGGQDVARAGSRAGLFHPLTSYSVPDAVRLACAVADRAGTTVAELPALCNDMALRHWRGGRFYRMLSTMLFAAAEPARRYRVLQRFYRLDPGLIERFYAGRNTMADKVRVLAGRPPVPLVRAVGAITGLGARPAPLRGGGGVQA